ncbi:MAG: DUF1553 domain-containing protein [Planctomycetota bacterium]
MTSSSRMRSGFRGAALTFAFVLCGAISPALAEERTFSREDLEFFDIEVHPILQASCNKCHGSKERIKAHFRVTSREGLIRGGDRGPAINLEDPKKSLFLEMISYKDENHSMPPTGKLSDREIGILTRWVELGAPFNPKKEIRATASEKKDFDPTVVSEKTKQYWAFKPYAGKNPPKVDNAEWSRHPIDAFVYHRLAEAGLKPNGPASRRELIRRAYYNLIGLPPSLAEVQAFENDKSADAFEKVIDHLLDSPHYGEKWARHWLDLVRYAESNGYERDSVKPMAWGYRDYIIRAFNKDKPYDLFVREQIAGDEFDSKTADSITATGFQRLGLWDDEPADRALARYEYLDSIVATMGELVLGLTIGCARCHDHKLDPIPQKDYYQMVSFFANISPHGKGDRNLVSLDTPAVRAELEKQRGEKAEKEFALHSKIFTLENEFLAAAKKKKPELVEDFLGPADIADLKYRFYRDTWDKLPKFDDLRPETTGVLPDGRFTLQPALRRAAMGFVYEGKLRVPADGEYRFYVRSKDGSRLTVGEKKIGEESGTGTHEYSGAVQLKKGYAPIRFDFFNKDGGPELDVEWSSSDFSQRSLANTRSASPGIFFSDARGSSPSEWMYTTRKPNKRWADRKFRANGWKKGIAGFGTKGTPGAIVRTTWNTKEIWLRKTFEVRGELSGLILSLHHDEDATILVNGAKVHEARGHRREYTTVDLAKARPHLREGINVLAIHCRQTGGGQYIDAGLSEDGKTSSVSRLIADHGDQVLGAEKKAAYQRLKGELTASQKAKVSINIPKAMAVGESGRRTIRVLLRGNPHLPGDEVQPGFPSVLSPPKPSIKDRGASSGRRSALADWLVDAKNPLTARVAVNRLWQFQFGRGIVRSPSNFGRLGDRPTHPELLDWLAAEFVRQGWKMKAFHKLLMTSRTYQMSSRGQKEALAKDPTNNLLWRFDMRRLTAEEIRDSMLAVTGKLNTKMFGPSMYPELPDAILRTSSTGAGKWGRSSPEERNRRAIYIFIRRSLQDPMLKTFDFADTDSPCSVRFATTVPTQALTMLNSKFVSEQAEAFAASLTSGADNLEARVKLAIERALSRSPHPGEVADAAGIVKSFQKKYELDEAKALERYSLILLNLNEFFYID